MARKKAFYNFAVKTLRHGFVDPETGRRVGKFADGFEARDGFNLREIDDWTPAQKARVTKLFNMVDHLAARPYKVYRARRPDNLRAVQRAAQHETFPPALKVAFVPVADPAEPTDIRISPATRKVTVRQLGVRESDAYFDDAGISMLDIVRDPFAATMALTEAAPADRYAIQAGKYEIRGTYSAEAAAGEVRRLVNKYGADKFRKDDTNSSYFGNWLFGLNTYNFEQFGDFQEFRATKERERQDLKDKRARDKRRFRKKYGVRRRRRK